MKTFLEIVAHDLNTKYNGDFSSLTIVFPNKRASLFFNKALADITNKPIWSPQYTTISDMFRQYTPLETGDRIKLVCDLYKSYKKITGTDESLDRFYGWGELLINDFDDIDKHMADATKIFSLLSDVHELDGVEYLSENQQQVLQQFFSNFTKDHNTELKMRFLKLWNRFNDIYIDFRNRLRNQGIAYEGMLYRDVIEYLNKDYKEEVEVQEKRTYIFVGFNLLHKVETELFSFFQKRDMAKFYWDYDVYYMKGHEAGKYIAQYLKYFPNELATDNIAYRNLGKQSDITFISSPTEDMQARYIAQWLTPERIEAGRRTAIVLADEGLLETALHCLPESLTKVNITTGYPLEKASITSFVRLLALMLQKKTYTLHAVNAILRHPLAKYISDKVGELHEHLNCNVIFYPSLADLTIDQDLENIFQPLQNIENCEELNERLLTAIKRIANRIPEKDDFLREAIYRMYSVLNRLKNLTPKEWSIPLYINLVQQIVRKTTIPFHGEPIEGIQIMGVLETRNLDFDHLLLLSCNEGKLPAKINDTSFLPHSIRHGYGLTTIDNKVAIYAYYFHRLLQRTSDAHILYNSSTNNGQTGEMSRFMLQLAAESKLHITRKALIGKQDAPTYIPHKKEKNDEIIQELLSKRLISPSSLSTYLRCPLRFYYKYVSGINDDSESDEEEMDLRTFGNIFHKAAELIYAPTQGRTTTTEYIDNLLKEKGNITIQRIIEQAFRSELFQIKDENRPTPRLSGLQLINRQMILTFIKQLLTFDKQYAPFTILATEGEVSDIVTIDVNGKHYDIRIGGIIDRLDTYTDKDGIKRIRVIDYKTGRLQGVTKQLSITSIDDIFDPANIKNHSDYFLQALMYSSIVGKKNALPVVPAIIYVQHTTRADYTPYLKLAKEEITDISKHTEEYNKRLKGLLANILDKQKPFIPLPEFKKCEQCPYSSFCC